MKKGNSFKRFFGRYSVLYQDLSRVENKLDNLLMYVDFYTNKHNLPIILMKDSSVILLFCLQGIDYESLSLEKREDMSYYIRTAFEQLDPGIVISNYMVRCRSKVPKLFNPEKSPEIIMYMQECKQIFWDRLSEQSYENKIFCCVRYAGKKSLAGAVAKMNVFNELRFTKFFREEIDARVEKVYDAYLKLKSSLERFGFKIMSKDEIHQVLYEMVNHSEAPAYRNDISLNGQLAHSRYTFQKKHLVINDLVYCNAINIKYPPQATFALLLKDFYCLDLRFTLKQIFEPFKYAALEKKINFYQNIALSLSHFDKGCQHYMEDVAEFKEKVTSENQMPMFWNWTMYLYSDSLDELEQNTYFVKNKLREMGSCGLEEVENLKYSIFSLFPGHEKLNKRNHDAVILSANAGDVFSAFNLDKGDNDPIEYFLDRNNGIFSWNPFTSRENAWHMAITGPTGQGKSFFVNHMVLSMLVYEPLVYIIDLSKSYRALFEILRDEMPQDVTIMTFSADSVQFSLNPFLLDLDEKVSEEQISFCEGLLGIMCGTDVITETNKIVVRESLEQFFEEYQSLLKNSGGLPVRPLDVLIPILEQRSETSAVPNKMKLWTLGRKGQLINSGIDDLTLAKYCYFDIDTEKMNDELSLIVYCLFSKIMKDIGRPDQMQIQKFLILDEAYHYLHVPEFQYYVNRLIRTGRHYNLMVSIITQSITDLVNDSDWSKGIINNLKQAIFFAGQKNHESSFRMMQMEDYHIDLYNHMDGRHREMLYWSANGIRRVLRLIPDSFSYWLSTTDPQEKHMRRLINDEHCNGDMIEAIKKIIEVVQGSVTNEEKKNRLKAYIEEKKMNPSNPTINHEEEMNA